MPVPRVERTAEQLAAHIATFIDSTYAELGKVQSPMNEDFLTTGIRRFNERLQEVATIDFRFMGLLDEARRLELKAGELAEGKKTLAEEQVVMYVTQTPRPEVFKGLAADERKAYARIQCKSSFQDADAWKLRSAELKTLIKHVTEQRDFLHDGQQRLMASLWSVRVHGALGELQKTAPQVSRPGFTMMSSVAQDARPELPLGTKPVDAGKSADELFNE